MANARSGRGDEARLKTKGIVATFQIGGVDFVVVSKADYLSKRGRSPAASTEPELPVPSSKGPNARSSLASRRLFDARRQAGLSQAG